MYDIVRKSVYYLEIIRKKIHDITARKKRYVQKSNIKI